MPGDKYSHLKMVMAVGVVMGLHAAYEVFVGGTVINLDIILTYLPVSILYILSMAMGYVGLRYIELSISSPICNSSGALVAVLTLSSSTASPDTPPWPCSPWRWCVWAPWAWAWWRPGRMTNCGHRAAEGKQLQVHQELHGPGHACGLLRAGRRRHLCRQPGAGDHQPHRGGLRGQRQRGL